MFEGHVLKSLDGGLGGGAGMAGVAGRPVNRPSFAIDTVWRSELCIIFLSC